MNELEQLHTEIDTILDSGGDGVLLPRDFLDRLISAVGSDAPEHVMQALRDLEASMRPKGFGTVH